MERMQKDDYYQFPAELDAGEYRSRDDMLQMLFTASAFGDRGVRFAYWYEHGTISAPMPTTYDQLQRWIISGDFQQAFYINEDLLETPDFLDEEAASDARIDDLLNPSSTGALTVITAARGARKASTTATGGVRVSTYATRVSTKPKKPRARTSSGAH
jgi:hypothetical protein